MEENITDRISELPAFIIHHILSYLDCPKDLVRMRILSNYWFELTASFPILNFNLGKFMEIIRSSGIPVNTEKDKIDIFLKYVENTVSRFCEQNVSVHTFNLVTSLPVGSEVDIIDRCLGLILEKGVKVLVIETDYMPYVTPPPHMYRLPNILLSASSLTSMKIHRCGLPSSLMVDIVRFKSLKVLHLTFVRLSEEMIKRLTTSCSLLEKLTVKYCRGFKRFCVGLPNLQQLDMWFWRKIERIEIDAPKLIYLCLMLHGKAVLPSSMNLNLASCKSVTQLCYQGGGKELANLLSNFPILEYLFLDLRGKCMELTLSSHSLRTVMILTHCDLRNINIDSPNLLLFSITDFPCSYYPMEAISDPSKSCMQWVCNAYIQAHWFQKLRQFLDKKIQFKELKLHINQIFLDKSRPEEIQWPPVELEHVELEVKHFEDVNHYECVVECLLRCCRPQSLTLIINFSSLEFKEWCRVVEVRFICAMFPIIYIFPSTHIKSYFNKKIKCTLVFIS